MVGHIGLVLFIFKCDLILLSYGTIGCAVYENSLFVDVDQIDM